MLEALGAAELAQLLTSRFVAPPECAYICRVAALLALEQLVRMPQTCSQAFALLHALTAAQPPASCMHARMQQQLPAALTGGMRW